MSGLCSTAGKRHHAGIQCRLDCSSSLKVIQSWLQLEREGSGGRRVCCWSALALDLGLPLAACSTAKVRPRRMERCTQHRQSLGCGEIERETSHSLGLDRD